MKLAKMLSLVLVAVFAVSFQSEAKPKMKEMLKKLKKEDKKEAKFDYVMKDGSDLESDIKKMLPKKSELVHQITYGVFGPANSSKGSIIIVPYVTNDNGKVMLMLLIPVESGKYRKMMVGEIAFNKKPAGAVMSVFFDQADKDKERELFILCGRVEDGEAFYETAVFDWKKDKFERVPAFESKIVRYYPAINVRRVLRAMESASGGKTKK